MLGIRIRNISSVLLLLCAQTLFADNPNNPSQVAYNDNGDAAVTFEVDTGTTRIIYGTAQIAGSSFTLPATDISTIAGLPLYSFGPKTVIARLDGSPNAIAAWLSINTTTGITALYATSHQSPFNWTTPATLISDVTDDVLPDFNLSLSNTSSPDMSIVWRAVDTISGNVVLKVRNGSFPNTWNPTSQQLSP